MGRTLAIGDIHGCLAALETLEAVVRFSPDDTVVTLGDYVDRGPDSRGVIDYLISLATRCRLITLRGNHEIMMEHARDGGLAALDWMRVGGDAALDSYGVDDPEGIPESHWKFIAKLLPYYKTDTHFFVHANVNPERRLRAQADADLYWQPFGRPKPHISGRTMVCGHTPQHSGLPLNYGHAVCIDTRAHGGGWLTCLDVGSGRYWQSNQKSEWRTANIDKLLVS